MRRSNDRLRATARQHPLRALLALAALLIACAVPAQAQEAPPAGTAQDPIVSIQPADPAAAPLTIPWSRLINHLSGAPFWVPDGENGQRSVMASVSLRTILNLFDLELTTYNAVAAPRAGTYDLVMSGQSLMANSMTAGVFQDTDGQLKLVRSATGDDARIIVVPSADNVLRLNLRQEPAVTALPSGVREGGSIRFVVTVPFGYDPASLTYEWYINDAAGTRFKTSEPGTVRRFDEAGDYNVTVTYLQNGRPIDSGQGLTSFAVISRERPDDGYLPERDRDRVRTAGGRGKGVRDAPQEDAPDDAATDAPEVPQTSGDGSYNGGGSSGYTPPAPAATPPPTPDPAPTAPATPVRRAPQRRAPARRAAAPELPQGETVDGYLLASATGVPVVPSAAITPADQELLGLKPPQADRSLHVPTGVWVALGLLLLVVLGWGLESRTTLPYFRP
ncbi:PKD domain-containing protein [Conexibacter stalactiti]|uniref:PKD domain-containing protein n=1 Tax=Conexibacter stalactiti TaxID=1940611 RepID=A0ABU4HIQ9_9ACTN|nr:PKD domain-containing protein [Conexibacter stalactiti]MDW5593200.1 hypothetical protein [Conexibacter stalactiti]MEC5033841.1 PKD domain-containing protein [Conexibacter stalactiti]